MAEAKIVIIQDLVPSIPGRSRDDIVAGSSVRLENADDAGVRGWRWRMVSRPTGSAAVLNNTVIAKPTFTPDVEGSYLVELTVNGGADGEVARSIVAVRNAGVVVGADTFVTRYLAAEENTEANWLIDGTPNTTGWWEDMDRWMRLLLAVANAGGGGGGGIPEAPSDGTHYGRRNATWRPVPGEAPADGQQYARKDNTWEVIPSVTIPIETITNVGGGVPVFVGLSGTDAQFATFSTPDDTMFVDAKSGLVRHFGQGPATDPTIFPQPDGLTPGAFVVVGLTQGKRAVIFNRLFASLPSATVRVELNSAIVTGRRVGLYLPEGNADFELVLDPTGSSIMLWDGSGTILPDGAQYTIPAGTYPSDTMLVFELVENAFGVILQGVTASPDNGLLPLATTFSGYPRAPDPFTTTLAIFDSGGTFVNLASAAATGADSASFIVPSVPDGDYRFVVSDSSGTLGEYVCQVAFGGILAGGGAITEIPSLGQRTAWMFDWDRQGGGAPSLPSWADTLGVGDISGGNSPKISLGDAFTHLSTPFEDSPGVFAEMGTPRREAVDLSGTTLGDSDWAADVVLASVLGVGGSDPTTQLVTVKVVLHRHRGTTAPGADDSVVLQEVWGSSSGSAAWGLVRTDESYGDTAQIRIGSDGTRLQVQTFQGSSAQSYRLVGYVEVTRSAIRRIAV